MRLTVLVLASVLLWAACDTPTAPTYGLNEQFTLAPGDTATIRSTTARIRFEAVLSDSRCPINAMCIQAGDAVVRIQVWSNTTAGTYDLHTANAQPVTHDKLTISLVQVSPYPSSGQSIAAKDYRATLIVK